MCSSSSFSCPSHIMPQSLTQLELSAGRVAPVSELHQCSVLTSSCYCQSAGRLSSTGRLGPRGPLPTLHGRVAVFLPSVLGGDLSVLCAFPPHAL